MNRLVLDTNVLVSGLLSSLGPPGEIVDLVLSGQMSVVATDAILEEYEDVLRRPKFRLSPDEIESVMGEIRAGALPVTPQPWPLQLPDTDDAKFLAAARDGGCPVVTGNIRDYPKAVRAEVELLTPRQFVDRFLRT